MQEEIWKDVVGYEGVFQVSNLGNIKNLPRLVNNMWGSYRPIPEKLMGKSLNKHGYYKVSLRHKTIHKTPTLHRLVAEAFIPNPENKPAVNHINGIKTDNRVENLEWCTVKENAIHAVKIGLFTGFKGEKNHNCKVTEDIALSIRKEYIPRKVSAKYLGEKYGISETQILRIAKGTRWKYL